MPDQNRQTADPGLDRVIREIAAENPEISGLLTDVPGRATLMVFREDEILFTYALGPGNDCAGNVTFGEERSRVVGILKSALLFIDNNTLGPATRCAPAEGHDA